METEFSSELPGTILTPEQPIFSKMMVPGGHRSQNSLQPTLTYVDSFGTSVFIDGDRALVGAPGDDNYIGAAYVFALEERDALEIVLDIKPGSDSNPLNPKSKGVLPVAILGSPTFDVMTIDPDTLRLSREGVEGEVAPIRASYGDVSTSVETAMAGCLDLEGDGYMDLKLKFATQRLVEVLRLREVAGQSVQLTLTGTL